MAQIGRISGPLLFANLERQGNDLSFSNQQQTEPLLFLDVNNHRIGVDTDSPTKELQIPGHFKTDSLVANQLTVSAYNISDSKIQKLSGNINLVAETAVRFGRLSNDTILIKDNTIFTELSNSSVILTPSGIGKTIFQSNTKVFGDFFTPKNITVDGKIIIGNESGDTVDFDSEINSDLIPDETNTSSLGRPNQRWNNTFTKFVNGQSVSTSELVSGQINFNLKQGNVFFVATNGNDDSSGDHLQLPFKTIRRALEAADASTSGPVSIYVFPGEYEEQFPLEVPNFVSVLGTSLRGINISPDTSSEFEDVFLLDGDTTIENLTIRDFYSQADKGYAFRFKPGAIIQNRSPYIKNVSVITKGTETSPTDPRGFESGDAGQGALIDGAALDGLSDEASMLFQSCTFITPGVDAITMTNGVRVEWLSSFTYFANRGLYAVNGSEGRTTADGSTIKFGAEIRAIASANIYGNFGAVADGDNCLMYLIQHNFAYVGLGKSTNNDKTQSVQAQEVIELNNGKIYFTSVDHVGTYRVGDIFFADFEKGTTSISNANLSGDELTNLRIENNSNETFFTYSDYFTGNMQVSNNLIQSFVGPININAPAQINLKNNTSIDNDLAITGNLATDSRIVFFGDATSDSVSFISSIDSNFAPTQDSKFNLGSNTKRWQFAGLDKIELPSLTINNNTITSVESNSSLEFRTSGNGAVALDNIHFGSNYLESNSGDFILSSKNGAIVESTKSLRLPIGTTEQIPLEPTDLSSLGNIRFNDDDSVFEGFQNATIAFGGVYSDDRETTMVADPAQNSILFTVDNELIGVINDFGVDTNSLQIDDVLIDNNRIQTNASNSDLELQRNGVGEIRTGNIAIVDNKIKLFASDKKLSFAITGFGYQKITGTNGFVLPSGSEAERAETPEIGETRWNTDAKIVEVWDGSVFLDASGVAQFVTEEEFDNLILEYSLMFG